MSQKIKTSVEIDGSLTASQIANATTDTDKFLVSDGGTVKYRTGAELASDLGIASGSTSKVQHQVKAGVAINKGQAVYVTSADGTNMIVGLASNASEATSSKTMGLLNATVVANGFADVVTEGLLDGLDTSTATVGNPVWLGTGGNLIYGLANKPYAPNHLVFIGIVTRVNANNGEIFVKVQNGFELDEIHDVDLKTTTKVNGHLLGYNGSLWVNKTIAEWLGYTPYNASNPAGYISSYTETDTLASVTARGATTGTSITVGGVFTTKGTNPYIQWQNSAGTRLGYIQHATNLVMSSDTGNIEFTPNSNLAKVIGNFEITGTLSASGYNKTNWDTAYGWGNHASAGYALANHTHIISAIAESGISPNGISIQAGPGGSNTQGWTYPYGTKLSAISGAGRSFEIMSTTYPDGQLVLRTLGSGGVWDSWKTILDTSNYSTYAVPTSRTITINGTTQDLSANRSFTVSGTVTSGVSITSAGSASNTPSTPSVNIGMYVDTYAFIDLSTSHPDGGWIDFSKANGTDYGGRIRYNNTSDYLSIAAGSNEQVRIFNSNAEALGSFRAPIFYDSNNTSYYGDFASTSRINTINIDTLRGPQGDWLLGYQSGTTYSLGSTAIVDTLNIDFSTVKFSPGSGNLGNNYFWLNKGGSNDGGLLLSRDNALDWQMINATGSGDLTFYAYGSGTNVLTLGRSGGAVTATGSMRAPIFYDSNDTGYYGDFASSGTSLSINGGIVTTAPSGSILLKHEVSEANAWLFRENAPNWGLYWFNTGTQSGQVIGSYTTIGAELFGTNNAVGGFNPNSAWTGTNADTRMPWMLSNYTGYIWSNSTIYAGGEMRAPIFYDSDNTGYYLNPASISYLSTLRISDASSGASLIVGTNDTSRVYSDDPRKQLAVNADYYPCVYVNALSNNGNTTHGAVISMSGNLNSGGYRRWGMGIANTDPGVFSIGYADNNSNPHYGVGGSGWSQFWIDTSGNTFSTGSTRSPIFYDNNNTAYYVDPASSSSLNTANIGVLTFRGVGGDSGVGSIGDMYGIYQQGGAWNYPFPDLCIGYHTGIKIGAYYSYNGTRFYNNSDWATITASVNDGDNNFRGYYDVIAYASDRRLKHKVKPIEDALSKVKSLTGMTYQWNEIGKDHGWDPDTEVREAGVFAQDVQAVLPEAVRLAPFDDEHGVSRSGENFLTVKYDKIVPLLIEAIKEQQTQIEELKELINKLINK